MVRQSPLAAASAKTKTGDFRQIEAQMREEQRQKKESEAKQKQEYRLYLMGQVSEVQTRKSIERQQKKEQDARDMEEFSRNYRFGNQVGGGAPSRKLDGSPLEGESPSASPTRQELLQMKPSNLFSDITEDKFQRVEAEKRAYQQLLLEQIESQNQRKKEEKTRKQLEDLHEEQRVIEQLRSGSPGGKSPAQAETDKGSQPPRLNPSALQSQVPTQREEANISE